MSDGDINAALGQSGPCPEVVCNGKTWKIGHPTQVAKAELNRIVVATAAAAVEQNRSVLPPAMFQQMISDLTAKIGKRYYQTWHEGWIEIALGQDGDILFLLSLLRQNHPAATEADARMLYAECGDQLKVAMAQVMPVFFQVLEADYPSQLPASQRETLANALRMRFLTPVEPTS